MVLFRRMAIGILLLAVLGILVGGLIAMGHWQHPRGIVATRVLAVVFMVCDVAIGTSLITLLLVKDRRPPMWVVAALSCSIALLIAGVVFAIWTTTSTPTPTVRPGPSAGPSLPHVHEVPL